MIAVAGGDSIRCAPYSLFGTEDLSRGVLNAMYSRRACLLANHGMVTVGASLTSAISLAVEVEALCEQYMLALSAGGPVLLSEHDMSEVFEQFVGYRNSMDN
jgi:L-fuculose-phosphate aldolase